MKRILHNFLSTGAIVPVLTLVAMPLFAQAPAAPDPDAPAKPPTSDSAEKSPEGPSAKMAATLAKDPFDGPAWLGHYLPNDRYKIAGKIWKFVAIENDKFYYLPTSREMLRRPADHVIGFPSEASAEEAGYLPDGEVAANVRVSNNLMVRLPKGAEPFAKATTVTLSDGASQVTVPAGWTHLKMPRTGNGVFGASTSDLFFPNLAALGKHLEESRKTKTGVGKRLQYPRMSSISTFSIPLPKGKTVEEIFSKEIFVKEGSSSSTFADFMEGMKAQDASLDFQAQFLKTAEMTPSSWGGARAWRFSSPGNSKSKTGIGSMIFAARGNKLFYMLNPPSDAKGVTQLRNSFVAK